MGDKQKLAFLVAVLSIIIIVVLVVGKKSSLEVGPACSGPNASFRKEFVNAMPPGYFLSQCASLVLKDGKYIIAQQSDGNLVVYNKNTGRALWASNTNGKGKGPYSTSYGRDGNLILKDSRGITLWAAGINTPSAGLYMQPDGNLVMYKNYPNVNGNVYSGPTTWATNKYE